MDSNLLERMLSRIIFRSQEFSINIRKTIIYFLGKYDVNIFANIFEWENSASSYKLKGEKYGTNFKIKNLLIEGGYLDDNKNNDGAFGSITLVLPSGAIDETTQDRKPFELVSVRDKLYQPV